MNKLYLGSQAIVDLSGYDSSVSALDASIKVLDASVSTLEGGLDSLTTTVSGQDASIQAIITDIATNYYNKAAIDASVAALEQEISAMAGIDIVVEDELPTASADTLRKIYLVPQQGGSGSNVKDEYVTVDNGAEANPRYTWELIGSTEVDLSNYATKTYVDTAVADVSTKLDASVSAIWTALEGYAQKATVDASIAVLDASVNALESEVKIYGNHTINNLVSCTSTAYASLTKDPSTLYVVLG